ncbi:MAG: hypothetical protein LBV79_06590, partial [Candidatus Adiutrix sp.]|nr:hypothetical protein [Candidatus Adiutrix sp.]
MPELPEVQTIAADLNEVVGGAVIEAAAVGCPNIVAGDPAALARLVTGRAIRSVERMGKWVRFNLEGPQGAAALLAHLKMTGQFHLGSWPGKSWEKHDHAAFRLRGRPAGADTLFYRDIRKFGRLRAFELPELEEFLAQLNQG